MIRLLLIVGLLLSNHARSPVFAQERSSMKEGAPVSTHNNRSEVAVEAVGGNENGNRCTKGRKCEKNVGLADAKESVAQQSPSPEANLSASELASQVNNPAAPVTLVQFRNVLVPNIPGTGGVTNAFQIQPVIPIHKSERIPFLQLIKMTLPVVSAPSPVSRTGLGDLQFFDLVSIKQSWGRWGFGPALVFPTATSKALGAGKWQAGPSFALIYTKVENLTMGGVLQNPISYAGDSSRPAVNNLIITPTFTYNVPGNLVPGHWKDGWFVGLSDFNITFDWRNGGAGTIPIGPQIGRVFSIGKQSFSASIEAGGVVKRPPNTPNPGLILGFEFSVIIKPHRRNQ